MRLGSREAGSQCPACTACEARRVVLWGGGAETEGQGDRPKDRGTDLGLGAARRRGGHGSCTYGNFRQKPVPTRPPSVGVELGAKWGPPRVGVSLFPVNSGHGWQGHR